MAKMENASASEYLIIDEQLYLYNKRENTLQPVINSNATNVVVLDDEEEDGNKDQESNENEIMSRENEELSENHNNNTKRWDDTDTLLLINLVITQKEKFNNKRFIKREIYKDIATEMSKQGSSFTPLQCENKLKFLINKYKHINDHNNRTGNNRKEWKFSCLMEDFMGDKDTVKPKAKCSSLKLLISQSQAPCVQHEDPKEGSSSSSTQENKGVKRRRLTPRGEMLKWLKDFEKKEEKREQERKEIAERHHEETMDMLNKFLEKK